MKKLLSLMLCILMVLGMTACGGSSEAAAPETEAKTETLYVLLSRTQKNGETESKVEYVYGTDGKIAEVVSYLNGEEVLRTIPELDDAGRILSETYANFGMPVVESYTYDADGNPLTFQQTDQEGNLFYKWEQTPHESLDFATRTMTNIMTMEDGSQTEMVMKMENKFDDNGKQIGQDIYVDGTLSQYAELTTDDQNRLLQQKLYSADGTLMSIIDATWNGNTGRMDTKSPDGTLTHYYDVIMDDQGNTLEQSVYSVDGTLMSYTGNTYGSIEVTK